MSDRDVEVEVARLKGAQRDPSGAVKISIEQALAFRNRGNIPDGQGRSLRLVLSREVGSSLEERRVVFEPDYQDEPAWRQVGSRKVTIIPIGDPYRPVGSGWRWQDDPEMGAMERTWAETGKVEGLALPVAHRGFIFKTIRALQRSGKEITPDSICASLARWLSPSDVEVIRGALLELNPASPE